MKNSLAQALQEYDLSTVLAAVSNEIRRRHPYHAVDTSWGLAVGYVDVARDLAEDAEIREGQMDELAELFPVS